MQSGAGCPGSGWLVLMLHAHLPFVRHPEHADFLEEDWLYEAITETYIPLLELLAGLERDRLAAPLTLSVTPPLCEMLADPLLQDRYAARLKKLQELADKELHRTAGTPFFAATQMYRAHFLSCARTFERWGRNLTAGFRHFQNAGLLELVTCGATHGFLPLMATESAVRAQLDVATANFARHFGSAPRGIWLPECAYRPGLDRFVKAAGLDYFFLDTHGVAFATPRPRYGPYRPIVTPHGTAVFARDIDSSKQVWSSEEGYPGDPAYREFYRDLGYDADFAYIRPYLHADGVRRNTGLKYHRITGRVELQHKEPYDPLAATERAATHAGNFMHNRQQHARWLRDLIGTAPVITAPFDAELFGHWWHEGPQFLNFLLRKLACDQSDLVLTTPGRYLAAERRHQIAEPAASSWGDKGYYEVWLNGSNDWLYRHLHAAEARMEELALRHLPAATATATTTATTTATGHGTGNGHATADGLTARALRQAARELLLAQSSDWAFIMTTGTTVAYAEKRSRDHLHRFNTLYEQLSAGRIDGAWLAEIEARDSIFPELDWRVYAPPELRPAPARPAPTRPAPARPASAPQP